MHSALMTQRSFAPPLQHFVEESRRFSFAPKIGLPGQVWHERRPLWVTDVSQEPRFDRQNLAEKPVYAAPLPSRFRVGMTFSACSSSSLAAKWARTPRC